jgi:hypothetical protein
LGIGTKVRSTFAPIPKKLKRTLEGCHWELPWGEEGKSILY